MEPITGRERLERLARRIRRDILVTTTRAGSGHATSSLSAADLMTGLLFGGAFRYDVEHPERPDNDRLIFSKGHASPLLLRALGGAGAVTEEELLTLRRFGSPLEGHPTPAFPFTEAATGSLGQGLSIGVGMALNAKYLDRLPYRTWVLLGDSEMAEGSQWEAIQVAALLPAGQPRRRARREPPRAARRDDVRPRPRRLRGALGAFGWETLVDRRPRHGRDPGGLRARRARATGR